jgi:hypothetical protein
MQLVFIRDRKVLTDLVRIYEIGPESERPAFFTGRALTPSGVFCDCPAK